MIGGGGSTAILVATPFINIMSVAGVARERKIVSSGNAKTMFRRIRERNAKSDARKTMVLLHGRFCAG